MKTCSQCAAPVEPGASSCPRCGAAVRGERPVRRPAGVVQLGVAIATFAAVALVVLPAAGRSRGASVCDGATSSGASDPRVDATAPRLPPGHPPIDGSAGGAGLLPPGHPPIGDDALPPGHPPVSRGLPPGHPPVGGPPAPTFEPPSVLEI